MTSMLDAFLALHTGVVETYTGGTPTGDGYNSAVTVTGFLDDGMVLTASPGGEQLESKTTFYTYLSNAPLFRPESRFTCNGRAMQVTSSRRRDGGSLLGQVSHLEVDLV